MRTKTMLSIGYMLAQIAFVSGVFAEEGSSSVSGAFSVGIPSLAFLFILIIATLGSVVIYVKGRY